MKISILATKEVLTSSLTGPLDVFSSAGVFWNRLKHEPPQPYFEVEIVAISAAPIQCFNWVTIQPHRAIESVDQTDLVYIPSMGLPLQGLKSQAPQLLSWLRKMYEQGATLAGSCTGVFLLAEAGLLEHKQAITHWAYQEAFQNRYPRTCLKLENVVIEKDRIISSAGGTSWHDLVLYIIEKFKGPEVALQCAKTFMLQWHQDGQLPYSTFHQQKSHGDAAILAAQNWIEERFPESDLITRCAEYIKMPLRTFKRRFKNATGLSPINYIQYSRIEQAKQLLESGQHTIEEISYAVGYDDGSFFRRLFKRHTGLTPNDYRRRFLHLAPEVSEQLTRKAS
jgi:transcriptional regulator GlxA family with amidase domain